MKRKVVESEPKVSLMLDSGAFSAWRSKEQINIESYKEYLLDNQEYFHTAVNLDVIPGEMYKKPSKEQVESSAKQGWKNCEYLESAGCKVMPVFHQGEDVKWLEMMMEGYDYIGISPDNGVSLVEKEKWLDLMFSNKLVDAEGKPKVRTHGFGMTAIHLMRKYPWYSCDSMTWLLAASYGGVFLPHIDWDSHEFDYDRTPRTVKISDKSPTLAKAGAHYLHLSGDERDLYNTFFMDMGYDLAGLQSDFVSRTKLNVGVLKRIASSIQPRPYRKTNWLTVDRKGEGKLWDFHLIFAVNFARKYSEILTEADVHERLFTYHLLRSGPSTLLRDYYYTGLLPGSLKAPDLSIGQCMECNGYGVMVDSAVAHVLKPLVQCDSCDGSGEIPSNDLRLLQESQR